ncbi:MAG: hypothetical protein IJS88_01515 [Alphaproteobacteria bacterium]|nr:hypothetical protein [Alphaproteobacteria bacterium]
MEINFRTQEWKDAKVIFDFFRKETNCFDSNGRLCVQPKYVVAIDNDPVSAYYAAVIMKQAKSQFGVYPQLLCVGGNGMLSKYLNRYADGIILSNGMKLRMVALHFGNFPVCVLDRGNTTEVNIKEIIDFLVVYNNYDAPLIFCVTQRLSKRLERIVAYSTRRFPSTHPLNAYYYVPGEDIRDVCRLYNGMALAGGLPLLSEAAALYDRVGTSRYVNHYTAEYDGTIPKYVMQAGMRLMEKYPLKVSQNIITAPWQYACIYLSLLKNRKAIAEDLDDKIIEWMQTF